MDLTDEAKSAIARDELLRRLDRYDTDSPALDRIAYMLRDPDWGVGMLEDIADIIRSTGRSLRTEISSDGTPVSTWERH